LWRRHVNPETVAELETKKDPKTNTPIGPNPIFIQIGNRTINVAQIISVRQGPGGIVITTTAMMEKGASDRITIKGPQSDLVMEELGRFITMRVA
jgi:hypothetical protein